MEHVMKPDRDDNWQKQLDQTVVEARARYTETRPKSLLAHQDASRHLPGGNTRTVLYHDPFPFRVVRGEGARIWDADGHCLVNMLGEYTAGLFGHDHPVIQRTVTEALKAGVNLGAHNLMESRFAEAVCQRFPAIEKIRFTNSGTEANLMALTAARAFTGKSKILAFQGGYHGGVFLIRRDVTTNAPYPLLIADYNDIESARDLIRTHGADLAAVITEPMLGSGGCIPATSEFLKCLRSETEAVGSLLIFDEVMTSRLGDAGAHGLYDIRPDLVTLGKWIGGGMSFGGFGGRADIMDLFDPGREGAIAHAGTFNNNVLTMSAGIAALTEIYPADRARDFNEWGNNIRNCLNAIIGDLGLNLQVTGMGSLMCLHPGQGTLNNYEDAAGMDDRLREILFLDLLEEGFYIARRGFIALSLALKASDLEAFHDAFCRVLEKRADLFRIP